MIAIILAAGMGRRLALGIPKCLIEIAGQTILQRQIQAFRSVGVNDFVIVVGYREGDVRAHVAGEVGRFTFVHNPRYAQTNTIYSLYLARTHFGSGFLYANGDVVFDRRLPERLVQASESTVLAVKPGVCGQEEVKVMPSPDFPAGTGPILRIGKQLDPALCFGEFVGVARFGEGFLAAYAGMLESCVESENVIAEHFEAALDRLCILGHRVMPVDIRDLPCGEIDFPADLEQARRELGPQLLS